MKKEVRKTALLEIGMEELPARFVPDAQASLERLVAEGLQAAGLEGVKIESSSTPRRLAVLIQGLPARAADRTDIAIGPPPAMAKDAAGKWTPAAIGFAKSQNVGVDKLVEQDTAKGRRLVVVHAVRGQATDVILKSLFPAAIKKLSFPKSMTWEAGGFRFARPLRWFVALFGTKVIRFELAGVASDRNTIGLLALGGRKIAVPSPEKYKGLLQGRCILVDPADRQKNIRHQMDAASKRLNVRVLATPEHLQEVVNLTEYPVGIVGQFKEAHLRLPREILISSLVKHQKFFPIETMKGQLTHSFLGVRNGPSEAQESVKDGYERVINARLADAEFFFEHDSKTRLDELAPRLSGVGFLEKVGSLADKVVRVRTLVSGIGGALQLTDLLPDADRAALLSKADLLTHIVGEFPELQGIAGRFYGLSQEKPAVAHAIEQHYWPLTADGRLPTSPEAALVALADKLDTMAANFSIGQIPSGSADPNGLRRLGAGVVRILLDQKWDLSLDRLVAMAFEALPEQGKNAARQAELKDFLIQRCSSLLGQKGFRPDEIDAVLSSNGQSVSTVWEKLDGLKSVRGRPEFGSLAGAIKRARNILKQANDQGVLPRDTAVHASDLQGTEQQLYASLQDITPKVQTALDARRFKDALIALAPLKGPVDAFFDGVKVMVDDEKLRAQRLSLLMLVKQLFDSLADFSKLQSSNP